MRLDSGNLELYEAAAGTADGNFATFWGPAKWTLHLNGGTQLMENGVKLLGARRTGWTAQTTTPARADMGATPSLATVYATLAAVIDDLTTHGLIGP